MSRARRDPATESDPGCLYDGSANPADFSVDELRQVRSRIPPATRGAGFAVITTVRSANFGGRPGNTKMASPFGIVLHHTGGSFTGDLATLTKAGTEVSANDYIDKRGRIFELCEFPKRAWHAGESNLHGITDWNTHGWGIEIENLGKGGDPYPRRQIDAIVWRCRERCRALGIRDPKLLVRHRDVCLPRGRKTDTSDDFPLEEVRRRVFAASDPTDGGATGGGLTMEKYNVAGLGWHAGLIATAFAGALRAEGVKAMSIHNAANVQAAAAEAGAAPFRKGPRLVAIGQSAANAVRKGGGKLGAEDKSDLFGVVGTGTSVDERVADTAKKADELLAVICRVEKKDPEKARQRFKKSLVGLADYFDGKV